MLAAIFALCAYTGLKGVILVRLIPAWQGPDEPGHYAYVLELARATGGPAAPLAGDGGGARDRSWEGDIVASLYQARFFSLVGIPAPAATPSRLDEVERLGGHPDQSERDTPLGYLPYAVGAQTPACQEGREPSACLTSLRLVSVGLAVAALLAIYWAAAAAVGPVAALVVMAGVSFWPLFGMASAVVNNDLPALVLAALWWGLAGRRAPAWMLFATAVVATAAKRSAGYLVAALLIYACLALRRQWRGRQSGLARGAPTSVRRLWTAAVMAFVLALAAWPRSHDAMGWRREGNGDGSVARLPDAAHEGRVGLAVGDTSTSGWSYVAQTMTLTSPMGRPARQPAAPGAGPFVRATVWARAGPPGATMFQLVLNDDRGTWLADTQTLRHEWQLLQVQGQIAPDARALRIALVPGDGTPQGTGQVWVDDARVEVGGERRIANGGFEQAERWGGWALQRSLGYLDLPKLFSAVTSADWDWRESAGRLAGGLLFTARTMWAGFAWATIWPPPSYTWLADGLLVVLVAAQAAVFARPRLVQEEAVDAPSMQLSSAAFVPEFEPDPSILRLSSMALLAAALIAVVGSTVGAPAAQAPQGRYLLPAALPLFLAAAALTRRRPAIAFGLVVTMAILDGWATWLVVWPAFRGAI